MPEIKVLSDDNVGAANGGNPDRASRCDNASILIARDAR